MLHTKIDEREVQIRIGGMAVSPEHKQGVGSSIVKELQEYASSKSSGIWCNARIGPYRCTGDVDS